MRVYDKTKTMKDSQTYPIEFGGHMLNEWENKGAKNVRLLEREELAPVS